MHPHAGVAHRVGELWQCQIDPVIDLHLRRVGIGVDGEVNSQTHIAGGGTGRLHIDHIVDTVDLRFQWRRDGIGDGLRIRARVGGVDSDLHRDDLRVLRDRQTTHGHQSRQHHHNRQYRSEYRPLDKRFRDHG